eukprot:15471285-Alexandrium_andersonii.AAC.1
MGHSPEKRHALGVLRHKLKDFLGLNVRGGSNADAELRVTKAARKLLAKCSPADLACLDATEQAP